MATLEEVLDIQRKYSILQPPTNPPPPPPEGEFSVAATPTTLQFALRNNTSSSRAYAYVTGLDVSRGSVVALVQSDGKTVYYPQRPSADLQPLQADCAIPLGAPGVTKTITVPRMTGGRVWFSQDATLTFLLNRADGTKAALVEPSVMNPSDKNYELSWSFCEFTLNEVELFANISYVDFINHPISMTLESTRGTKQFVAGTPADGLDRVAQKLVEQNNKDKAGWDKLVIRSRDTGRLLRAVSPNTGLHLVNGLFSSYYTSYVDQVWQKYTSTDLTINTQYTWGVVKGRVSGGQLAFGSIGFFGKPSAQDIFSSDSGAFAPPAGANQQQMRNMAARLAAAFNRGTMLINANQPDGEVPSTYYQNPVCNHYSRILHEVNIDGRGYAFPYDDVVPTNGADQAGTVADGSPKLLTIVLGGGNTTVASVRIRDLASAGRQMPGGVGAPRASRVRRSLAEDWPVLGGLSSEDEKKHQHQMQMQMQQQGLVSSSPSPSPDLSLLERGEAHTKLQAELAAPLPPAPGADGGHTNSLRSLVPSSLLARLESLMQRVEDNPAYNRLRPVLEMLARCVAAVLSMSLRAVASRVAMLLCLVVFYFVLSPIVRLTEQQQQQQQQ